MHCDGGTEQQVMEGQVTERLGIVVLVAAGLRNFEYSEALRLLDCKSNNNI